MEKIMTLQVEVGESKRVGNVPEGNLVIIPITGGTFFGEHIRGTVCPGGADWNVTVSQELCHVLARYWIQTDDGAVIAIENEGWLDLQHPQATLRTTPRFCCDQSGPYAYLMRGLYAGELRGSGDNRVEIGVWKLS